MIFYAHVYIHVTVKTEAFVKDKILTKYKF